MTAPEKACGLIPLYVDGYFWRRLGVLEFESPNMYMGRENTPPLVVNDVNRILLWYVPLVDLQEDIVCLCPAGRDGIHAAMNLLAYRWRPR